MKRTSWLSRVWYRTFWKPAAERAIVRTVLRQRPSRIVEIGMGGCDRAERLIRLATRLSERHVVYTGIDLFESAPADAARVKYKDAYRRLNFKDCTIKLIPGDPLSSLTRVANTLTGTELLIIGTSCESGMEPAWKYVPRMLVDRSCVFLQQPDGSFRELNSTEVSVRAAGAAAPQRRAA